MSQIDIQAFLQTHSHLHSAIEGLSDVELRWKARPEAWSVTEVLTHLLDHHLIVSFRIREILADSPVQLPGFQQDNWVNGQHGNTSHAEEILDTYKALLHYNSLLFKRLTEADLQKNGINQKGDTVRIPDIVGAFIKHVHHHIGQIDRIKQSQAALLTETN
ncbi:DinB family protein [Brevibacillus choshinensis]|uniref:DinB family protein n=1 Tax=Brevibacillus choshinensis TaxID=54911 RepID=A0ABX7FHK5_BRECH|nr:DinB family protein [Brevibacillus choshinensis]QRG65172.1 DinB family protein [Brevibacillus choshinensis]